MNILVVCHGNINRSALAHAILGTFSEFNINVRSAGMKPTASGKAARRMREFASDGAFEDDRIAEHMEQHRARPVTQDDLEWADFVVYMDGGNLKRLQALNCPPTKLVCLGAFCNPPQARIPDPHFMSDIHEFTAVAKTITDASYRLAEHFRLL